MTMWLVRMGGAGEHESLALDGHAAIFGWSELPDLTPIGSRPGLQAALRETYPDAKARTVGSWLNQIWSIRETMQPGDLVALPLKSRPCIAFGTVAGAYRHRSDLPGGPAHTRPVTWFAQVPRSALDPDVLFSFGACMTVCRVERNAAEARMRDLLAGRAWPAAAARLRPTTGNLRASGSSPLPLTMGDFEERSRSMIRERIAQKFKGHRLAMLVAALLEARGFRAQLSQPGPDGGVDILAGSGPLGFESPRMVVQVKSQDTKLDVHVLREVAGVMHRYRADHGLLVGWGGFNQAVRAEAAAEHFRLRLWDAGDVVRAVMDQYGTLPWQVRADIPMKQVWTLVPAEAGQDATGRAGWAPGPADVFARNDAAAQLLGQAGPL